MGISTLRSVLMPAAALVAVASIWAGLAFLRDPDAATGLVAAFYDLVGRSGDAAALRLAGLDPLLAKGLTMVVALTVGVGGVWLLYAAVSAMVERLGPRREARLMPWVFVGPALLLLGVFLVYPVISTIATSLTEDGGGLNNYLFALTDPSVVGALRNNVLWLVVATGGSVILGLLIASLLDRVKREALAKTFIFLPLAISMVGASIIWGFMYAWRPEGQPQIGLLNAVWTATGAEPVSWLQERDVNTLALIVIMIWLQTGFAMIVLSAAIKGVSNEIVEAARLDGASERQLFFRIVVPMIKGSIITVATTIAIAVLKVFDIVYVTTGGRFDTDVVANRMFIEMFRFGNFGQAAALAVILFIAVLPLVLINVRNLRRQGIGA